MFRLFGLATLLIRPAVWVLVAAAFGGGLVYERGAAEKRCDDIGGVWERGLCAGAVR